MTAPVEPAPSKAKSYVALIGSLLAALVPIVLQVATALPPPYPALAGGLVALLTMLGVYHAPYVPKDSVVVPARTIPIASGNPDAGGDGSYWPAN